MTSPLARIPTHTCPNVEEIMNFGDLSNDFFLTDKDKNKIPVPGSVQLLLEMNSSIVEDGTVMYAKQPKFEEIAHRVIRYLTWDAGIALNSLTAVFGDMVEQDQARGGSATCFLEVMHDASYLTCFGFLWAPGSLAPVPDPFSPISFTALVEWLCSPPPMKGPVNCLHMFTLLFDAVGFSQVYKLMEDNLCCWICLDIISVGSEESAVPSDPTIIVLLEEMGTTDLCKGSFQRGIYTVEMDVMKGKMHSLLKSLGKLFGLSTVPKFPQVVMAAIKFPFSSFSHNPLVGSTSQNPTLKPGPNSSVFISSSISDVDEILGGGLCLESLIITLKGFKFFFGTLPNPMLSQDNKPHDRVEQEKGLRIAWQYKTYFKEGEQTSDNRNNKLEYCNDCDLRKTWERHILTRKPIECVIMEDSTIDSHKQLDYEYVPNDTLHHVMDWVARIKYSVGAIHGLAYLQDDCHPRTTHWDIQSSIIFRANNFEGRVLDFGLAKLALEADSHVSSREMELDSFLVVRELAKQETDNGIFKMLRSDVTRFLTSILIGTIFANIGATALVIEAATKIFGEAGVSAATGVTTVAVLLLPEINPTSIAVPNATEVARLVVRPVLNFSPPPFLAPTFIMRQCYGCS
ncbi:hypothetical protein Nepgr_032580 [Nepenthes gracilis]|uniref:CNNM transmembrane domain-containing protein n=1 Tax=Nepenthes gracilis TaxID=150966 RepID=A0AAD3TL44_NEPGR|nr:hypothetical protein Nepgr_032580 [Nepenthes gracilis]